MNGEVNQAMEDVERMPLANLENSQQILDKIVINSVDPEAFSDIASVNPEIQEEIVQISVLKSVESEEIAKNTFNSENQKEIKEYSINSQESDKVVETKTVDFDNRNENVKITDYEDLDEHKDTREIYTADSEGSVEVTKIPFTIVDTTKEIIKTPLVVSEKSEELREVVLTYSEEPEETLKIPFQNTEGAKEIIEISLADSEESEKNIDTPLVNSDDSKQSIDLEDVENEDHVIQIATTKSLNDTYNDTSQEDVINGNTEDYETDYSDGIRSKVTTIEIIQLPDSEFTSNDVESPNCSNSNGSFAESMASSQTKSETTNQQPIDTVNENSNNYLKSENDSQHSEDEGDLDEIIDADVSEEELKTTDTGSINSDTEPKIPINEVSSRDNETEVNTSENITVEGEQKEVSNGNPDDTSIPEINSQLPEDPIPLRRSSRAIKRKRYTDDLENVEEYEIGIEDSQRHKSRPMGVNHTKIRIEMSATSTRFNQGNRQKVFIDGFSERTPPAKGSGYSTHSNQNTHYNMYVPRNTNTGLNRTNTVANNSSQTPSILPSLTDDMYVVEAPSFIVPYVYEKPSMVPFREFVESLGEELKEQRAKDVESLEKHKDIECNNKNNKVTRENSEGSGDEEKSHSKKKKEANKEKRRIKNDDDDASWNGESTTESEEDIISDEEDKISIVKDKGYSVDQTNRSSGGAPAKTVIPNKSDSYFDCSLGNFFMGIGNNLVQEYVQNDLLKQENRKLYKAKKLGHNTKGTETSIISLKKNLELSKYNNAPYALQLKKCPFCTFKSESNLILAHHLEAPHVKNNIYKCNLCTFEVKTPLDILNHMDVVHGVSGRLERSPACHQCPNCTFEDNSKGKLARHIISCMKKFKPETNLSPPFDWEPPAKIPKISKARNSMVPPYQNTFGRGQISNSTGAPIYPNNMKSETIGSLYRIQTVNATPKLVPVHGVPIMRNTVMLRHNAPVANSSNFNVKQKSMHQPSISITPLPRQPQPVQSQQTNLKNTFVICEICDGYIKDLEQLRNHMQSIHKVKIHPKMIYNRPPLNCQKCQFRFFTDQGLERHLLGSHGLVTSSMQEAANRGKDAGRCPVCGRVYQWKLLNHVARDHNLSLKPAHLSYKCTVCAATFGMYKQFENHVYSAHSVVARRVIDKSKAPAPQNKSHGNSASLYKPVKINDEITIIPQTTKSKDK